MRFDAVVVGAGPAGSTTALLLARAGFDVALLDRCSFPRPKPCGDCLSPNVSCLLDRLGVLDAVLEARPARLEGWRIVSPDGHAFSTRFAEITDDPLVSNALAISRDRFDAVLLDQARFAGVSVRTGWRVTGLDGDGVTGIGPGGEDFRMPARLTVGADGLRSVIARRAGLVRRRAKLRKVSLTSHVRHPSSDRLGEMHLADGICAGFAPVADGPDVACNLTIVADSNRFGRRIAADPAAFFLDAAHRFPRLVERLDDRVLESAATSDLLASGPFDVPVRSAVRDGLALVGDAAGYYDPFTGQGINMAIEGAFLLADEAVRALRESAGPVGTLEKYAHELRRHVRGTRSVQRMIEFVLSRAGLANAAIRRLAASPAAARALVATTGDLAPPRSVLSPAVLLALLAPAVREEPA